MSVVNVLGCDYGADAETITKKAMQNCLQFDIPGTLPKQIGQLVELTEMELPNGVLRGNLPTQLGRLTKLTKLKLNHNQLTMELPTELFRLSRLETLELHSNALTGSIPTELGNLGKVDRLNLGQNQLTGRLPTEIGGLSSIVRFSVRLNQLTKELPTQIGHLQTVTAMELLENRLSGSIPTEIGELKRLHRITLTRNRITGSFPSEFGELERLNFVEIESNQLSHLPSQLGKLSKIRYFLASRNKLQGRLPLEFWNTTSLVWLDLSSNIFTSSFPKQMGRLTALSELRLMDNQFYGSIPSEIGELKQLSNSLLQENRLGGQIPTQIGRLPRLAHMDISLNSFTTSLPSEVGKIKTLKRLFAEKSNISGTIPEQLGELPLLRSLRLRQNRLRGEIPRSLGNLNLRLELSLDDNHLSGRIPSEIGRVTNLRALTLSDNELHGKLPSTLANLKVLGTLLLARNNFDISCDCELLSWFSDLVNSAVITDASSLPPCEQDNEYLGLYAHVLRSEKEAPCTAPVIGMDASASEAHLIDLSWTFDTTRIPREVTYSVEKLEESATEAFQSCKSFPVDSESFGSGFSAFAFQVDIRQGNNTRVHCMWAREARMSAAARGNFGFRFEGFSPATEYEFSVRALFLFFGRDQSDVRLVVGPRSGRRVISTKEYTPLSGPSSIRATSRAENEITITWSWPPAHLSNAFGGSTMTRIEAFPLHDVDRVLAFHSSFRTFTIRNLQIQSTYVIRLQARNANGNYGPFSENITVSTCPKHMKTAEGAPNKCMAVVGHFALTHDVARSCETLQAWALEDSLCLESGLTVDGLVVKSGVWRESLTSPDFVRCPHPEFCDGSSIRNGATLGPNQYCSVNHQGNYCEDCVPNFTRSGASCIRCDYNPTMVTQAVLGLLTGLLLMSMLILYTCQKAMVRSKKSLRQGHSPESAQLAEDDFLLARAVRVKVRIFFGFLQLLFVYQTLLVGSTIEFQLDVALRFLRFVSTLQFADFTWVFDLSCFWQLERHSVRLFSQTLLPIALVVLLLVVGKLSSCLMPLLRDTAWNGFVSAVLFILFLVYPVASLTIFETFWCESFNNADGKAVFKSALAADYATSCEDSAERLRIVIFAAIMVVVYPVGVVILYLRELIFYWKATSPRQRKAAAMRVDFLIFPYKNDRSWFEAYELIRKIVQVSIVGFLRYNYAASSSTFLTESPIKLAIASIGTNLAIAATIFLVYIQPYKHAGDFVYAVFSLCAFALVTQVYGGAFDGFHSDDQGRVDTTFLEEQRWQAIGQIVLVECILLFLVAIGESLWARVFND